MRFVFPAVLSLLLLGCVDPVVPEYDYAEGFILVEGGIEDVPGTSRLSLKRSSLVFGSYVLEPITDAEVSSIDDGNNETAWTTLVPGEYAAPASFAGQAGRSYRIRVALADGGTVIESQPEQMPGKVPIGELSLRFEQEAYYSDSRERFIPAFTILSDLANPAGAPNFYSFTYRTWAQVSICATCFNSVYRNGACIRTPASQNVAQYDYTCDGPCWTVTPGPTIELVSDERNPGSLQTGVEVARIDYTGSGGILAEVQQRTLSSPAFTYFRTLETLVEGSSGLNAPLPAPLYGNLTDMNDSTTPVLGYFSVSSLSSRRLYWNRDDTDGEPISLRPAPMLEPVSPAPPSAPCSAVGGTSTEPEGWNP